MYGGDSSRSQPFSESRQQYDELLFVIGTNSELHYHWVMILSYRNRDTQSVSERRRVRTIPEDIQRRAQRKLMILNNAKSVGDLRVPPGNRLESLSGEREGQHSIRMNDQWRIRFIWSDGNAHEVEIVDYH